MLITKHTAADGGREKIPVTFLSGRAAFSAIPVFMNIKVITINGNNDGDKNVLYNSFFGAVTSVAVAGGFIAFFCVAAQIVCDFNLLYPIEKLLSLFTGGEAASAVCRGLIEATAGCGALSATGAKLTLPLTGFLITFGGVSILLQQLSYFTKSKVSALYFICVKFIRRKRL